MNFTCFCPAQSAEVSLTFNTDQRQIQRHKEALVTVQRTDMCVCGGGGLRVCVCVPEVMTGGESMRGKKERVDDTKP